MSNKEEAITSWYILHSDAIFKYILLLIRNPQEAEDLTHETFIKAFNGYHLFQYQSNEKTWLFRIAHNVTMDYMRKQKPISLLKELIDFRNDPTTDSPEEIVQINERTNEIIEMIGKLKRSYSQVILLRKVHGFSIKETMQILNWSESKVKSTLPRALMAFEKQLAKEGYEYEKSIR